MMSVLFSVINSPLTDVGAPMILIFLGGVALLVFIPIILVEAIVLRLLKWDTFRASVRTSLIMNIISGILGAVIFFWVLDYSAGVQELIIAFFLSIIVEGAVMWLNKKDDIVLVLKAALIANAISYLGLFALYSWANP